MKEEAAQELGASVESNTDGNDDADDSFSTSESSAGDDSEEDVYAPAQSKNRKTLKLAFQFFNRPENKCSVPPDLSYAIEEYIERFATMMKLFGVRSTLRVSLLHIARSGDALEEYSTNVGKSDKCKRILQASAFIRIVRKKLETPEFKTMNRNECTNLTLEDKKIQSESVLKALEGLKKMATKLQKVVGGAYGSDEMLCDFYRRALQDEPFWPYVPD